VKVELSALGSVMDVAGGKEGAELAVTPLQGYRLEPTDVHTPSHDEFSLASLLVI
jgi:hypothetical protein